MAFDANVQGLSEAARRTEILRAREKNEQDVAATSLTARVAALEAGQAPKYQYTEDWTAVTPVTSWTQMALNTSPSINVGFTTLGTGNMPLAPVAGWYAFTCTLRVDRDCGWWQGTVKIAGARVVDIEVSTTVRTRALTMNGCFYLAAGGQFVVESIAQAGCIVDGPIFTMVSLF